MYAITGITGKVGRALARALFADCRPVRAIVCLGLFDLMAMTAQAGDTTERPIKQLNEASDLIHWPEGFSPKQTDAFVHNQIFINAPAKAIWSNLVNAKDWPSWYSNSADVQITDGDEDRLGPKSQFKWRTFGFPVSSRVNEFVTDIRLRWVL